MAGLSRPQPHWTRTLSAPSPASHGADRLRKHNVGTAMYEPPRRMVYGRDRGFHFNFTGPSQ